MTRLPNCACDPAPAIDAAATAHLPHCLYGAQNGDQILAAIRAAGAFPQAQPEPQAQQSDDAIHCVCAPPVPPGGDLTWHKDPDCPARLLAEMEARQPTAPQVDAQPTAQGLAAAAVSAGAMASETGNAPQYAAPPSGTAAPQYAAPPQTTAATPPPRVPAAPKVEVPTAGGWQDVTVELPEPEYGDDVTLRFVDFTMPPILEPATAEKGATLRLREGMFTVAKKREVEGAKMKSGVDTLVVDLTYHNEENADLNGLTVTLWCGGDWLKNAMPMFPVGKTIWLQRVADEGKRHTYKAKVYN